MLSGCNRVSSSVPDGSKGNGCGTDAHGLCRRQGSQRLPGWEQTLYLAKIAMDILAKHAEDHIGVLDELSFREKLWDHQPLRDFWMIGSRTERKLAGYGIHTMGDLALASITSEDLLYKIFGIDAELMIDHAWGRETCRMKDIKNYRTEEHSLSNGQVLMRNYEFEEGGCDRQGNDGCAGAGSGR